ncbi:hypothetical protein B0H34DRAFT_446900 [Crassisporium funariophilum]|nr:hypothetical protein B0H34DRAFT_446900 [Crassisporium funariophilum]
MPRAMQRSKSPDMHTFFHSRCRPSTPIEIPRRRRSLLSPLSSPVERSWSPDLIFDMSPSSPNFPLSAHQVIPLSTSSKANSYEPFMYTVPAFNPCNVTSGMRIPKKRSRQRVMPSATAVPIGAEYRVPRNHISPVPIVDSTRTQTRTEHQSDIASVSIQSTTKITGFIPLIEHQPPMSERPSRPVKRLSPPPRKESYSSSPWILPGKSDCQEDDVAYSQVDPSGLEFQRHLLGRIENRDTARFRSFHAACL